MQSRSIDVDALEAVAREAVGRPAIASAAIFVLDPDSKLLSLGAAAGIEGVPLERLAEAVRMADHPVAQTAADGIPGFDVRPIAPGGPALRSHLPLRAEGDDPVVGVLAVAHDAPLSDVERAELGRLADRASTAIGAGA